MSGFPEKGADLRESPGTSGELPEKSGELPGNPCITVRFHSERTSGEAAEKLPGRFGELPGKSGDFPELSVSSKRCSRKRRRKCVRNASEMRQKGVTMGLVLLGKEERSNMRQKCV